jgi:hypothetical protein
MSRWKSFGLPIVLLVLAITNEAARAQRHPPSDYDRMIFHGSYVNPIFGYSVAIPLGLVGEGSAPIAPNHGVTIALGSSEKALVYVDAEYNVFDLSSPAQQVKTSLRWLKEDGASDMRTFETREEVCDLPAVRLTVEYTDRAGNKMTRDEVFALMLRKQWPGIVYTIGLETRADQFQHDSEEFSEVLHSFKCIPPTG